MKASSVTGLETLLLVTGVLLLGWSGVGRAVSWAFQNGARSRLESAIRTHAGVAPPSVRFRATATRAESRSSGVVGRLEIPRLGVSAMIAEGTRDRTLDCAIGHLASTAFPGEPGNVALAGHRDSYFRPLRRVRTNDVIRIITPDGAFEYRVQWTAIVDPDRRDVLRSSGSPALTLITCYPFHAVGPAPRRFIVRAERV